MASLLPAKPSTHHGRTISSNAHKSQRPPPLTRRPTHSSSTVRLSRPGPLSPTTKRKEKSDEEKFDMATGFLPFCAMCEKQIMTPHNSVLYCSSSCQRQDSKKPLSASSFSLSPAPTPPSSPVFSRFIVPPLEPTKLPPSTAPSTATAPATIPDTHDLTSDLHPSEWNPSTDRHGGIYQQNAQLENLGYFAPTHDRAYSIPDGRHHRNSSLASLNAPVPSLSSSPSASPAPSPSPSPTLTHATATTAAQPTKPHKHDPSSKHHRPLPPLHKPSLSVGGSAKKSLELVMPQAAVRVVT
ncbi:hypothetical protein FQN54_008518 [Arachnomyces sp. PD_36]|nr:hypothetical protein FQN54_008518 [Arachnomyces sp. PD_36]